MKKTLCYTYLGENGTLTSPIHLLGIYSIKKYELIADIRVDLKITGITPKKESSYYYIK